ncbi:hypothetical protein ACVJMZ_001612 [Sinorhizobium medicae]
MSVRTEVSAIAMKVLSVNAPTEPLHRQVEERQVEQEEGQTEVYAHGVMQKEGDAGGAAGQKPGAGEKIEAEGCDEATGKHALDVLHRRVPRGACVPETENAACLCHG